MAKQEQFERISWPTVQRISEYLIVLEELIDQGIDVVSSRELAQLYGNNASQVRQDLSCLGHTGRVGQGYSVRSLEQTIRHELGLNKERNVALVGCGRLGTTLALHVPFKEYGMVFSAAFDISPKIIGTKIGKVTVEPATRIPEVCRQRQIELAVLTVPKTAAQENADFLIQGGVTGILNYTRVRLQVPATVVVQNRQIICSFIQLAHSSLRQWQ